MRFARVADLPAEAARAVVINVGTELVTTLALASTVKNADLPILLVNCEPTSKSTAHFDHLARRWSFDIIDAPRRPHGRALDQLFRETRAELVLLVDSDAEICDAAFVPRLQAAFQNPQVFGSGFVHGPNWLPPESGAAPGAGLYNERAWLPCVMFRTSHVRAALDAGASFRARPIYNDVAWSRRVSKVLAARFQDPYAPPIRFLEHLPASVRDRLRRAHFPWLAWARRDFYGLRPNYVLSDTGTEIYQWCKYQHELAFAGVSSALREGEVRHYWGVTRRLLSPDQTGNARLLAEIEDEVIGRLAEEYDVDWRELEEASHTA